MSESVTWPHTEVIGSVVLFCVVLLVAILRQAYARHGERLDEKAESTRGMASTGATIGAVTASVLTFVLGVVPAVAAPAWLPLLMLTAMIGAAIAALIGGIAGAIGGAKGSPFLGGSVGVLMTVIVSGLWVLVSLSPREPIGNAVCPLLFPATIGGIAGAVGGLAGRRKARVCPLPVDFWQFRLRTLLILVLLASVLLAWVASGMQRIRGRRRAKQDAVTQVELLGGTAVGSRDEIIVTFTGRQFGDDTIEQLADVFGQDAEVFEDLLLSLEGTRTVVVQRELEFLPPGVSESG